MGMHTLLTRAKAQFLESMALKQAFLEAGQLEIVASMAQLIAQSLKAGGKLMLCGNGGSAADAQHLAAELLVRLRPHCNRAPIAALSLALDSSSITACANDYSFEEIYSRPLEALAKPGDVLLGLSTSGRSQNVIKALEMALQKKVQRLGFIGGTGGGMLAVCEQALLVPSTDPNRIQEVHITAGHILMDLVEYLMTHDPV